MLVYQMYKCGQSGITDGLPFLLHGKTILTPFLSNDMIVHGNVET